MTDTIERAAEARHGGRYYTHRLAAMTPQVDRLPRLLAGAPDADLDRYARESAARMASGEVRFIGHYSASPRYRTWEVTEADARRPPALPEAAFDWPVYRAAVLRPVATAWEAARIAYAPDPDGTPCECGHTFGQHQTGDGPWTGFCGGTLGQLPAEYRTEGDSDDEPCACERPVTPDAYAAQVASIRARMLED